MSTTQVAFSKGEAKFDSDSDEIFGVNGTSGYLRVIQSSGSFAQGNNQNGLDTGARAADTWYHIWWIAKTDLSAADILFSTSATAPTMPSGWTYKRRIGAVKTDGSSNIIYFIQRNDDFWWGEPPNDISSVALSDTSSLHTVTTPPGIRCLAELCGTVEHSSTGTEYVYCNSPDLSDPPATSALNNGVCNGIEIASEFMTYSLPGSFSARVRTDTSSQVRLVASSGTVTINASTRGWLDPRGKDAV